MVERDPRSAREAIAALQAEANDALEDLRDLARGIYPPLLADRGLEAALAAQAQKATTPATVEADGVARYPREIESTVYFCALEALNNVAKYADATAGSFGSNSATGRCGSRCGTTAAGSIHGRLCPGRVCKA